MARCCRCTVCAVTLIQQAKVLYEVSRCAWVGSFREERMEQYLVDCKSIGWVPLQQIFEQVDAAVREARESFLNLVVLLPTHLEQVVTIL